MVGREILDPRSDQQTLGKKGPFMCTAGLLQPHTSPRFHPLFFLLPMSVWGLGPEYQPWAPSQN